jgi:hypothetical protein
MFLYALTILVSAFLLFQIEPVIAKMILPWFGGSAAVWATCLLFFQLVLLLGYLYAHAVHTRLRPARQAWLHVALLAASLAMLPVVPSAAWKPSGGEDPTGRILALLAATIGLPFLLLSSTGPLLQAWFARRYPGRPPYRLYALSNAGSMFALLGYPVLVEPKFTTHTQAIGWSLGYVAFAILCGLTAISVRGQAQKPRPETGPGARRPTCRDYVLWLVLPACASTLLLAITNHLSQDVAAIPFLWVLPLSLYLLTFIICFDRERWYWRPLFLRLGIVALASMAYALAKSPDVRAAIPIFSASLFFACMLCHGELARLKPDPRYLTSFYLLIAAGGALGGIFVGLLAPRLFPAVYELHIGLAACALLILFVLYQRSPTWFIGASLTVTFVFYLAWQVVHSASDYRYMVRNFYGELKIEQDDPSDPDALRKLIHGAINHGQQFLDSRRRDWPTTYYSRNSGVGLAIRDSQQRGPVRVGVIGLGTGTIASYGRPGDYYRFYDINPLVIRIARTWFSYVNDCKAQLDIVLGDARLSLEREPSQRFDVLAVDAFSGDSIPFHLLTVEAFQLYFGHLNSDGVLAVHISNKFLNLQPVVHGIAAFLHKDDGIIDTEDDDSSGVFGSTWVLVTSRPGFFSTPLLRAAAKSRPSPNLRVWTDNYSNLFQLFQILQ